VGFAGSLPKGFGDIKFIADRGECDQRCLALTAMTGGRAMIAFGGGFFVIKWSSFD